MTTNAARRLSINDILLVTDFPMESDPALQYAVKLVREHDANAHVLHPSGSQTLGRKFAPFMAIPSFDRGWRDLKAGRLVREVFVEDGRIGPRLDQMARDKDVDLALVGWRDANDPLRREIVEQVLAATTVPVLVLGPGIDRTREPRIEPATILYPTDFSPHAAAAAQHALSWAQEYQSWLTLLHVVEGVDPWSEPERSRLEEPFHRWMSELVGEEPPAWCEIEHLVDFGNPAERVISTARDIDAGLIVIGRAGMDGASHMGPGPTTMEVLLRAHCPVLVISDVMARRESLPESRDRRWTAPAMAA
jgi:nucleotide-binding universal stress UspA family protein